MTGHGSLDDAVPHWPDPGTEEARALGCLCDLIANHGQPPGTWVVAAGCPLHHPHRKTA